MDKLSVFDMKKIPDTLRDYAAPSCRKREVRFEWPFLKSGDVFGGEGNPGSPLDPGNEYDL